MSRQARAIAQVAEQKQRQHPELMGPLTWPGALRILDRENIALLKAPLRRESALLAGGGVAVIILNANAPARRHTYRVAHELAHLWLHAEMDEKIVYHMECTEGDDPREAEAETFAIWMLGEARVRRLLP